MNKIGSYYLYNHELKTKLCYITLRLAIEAAKETWTGCLILIGPSESAVNAAICVYRDMEDLTDEKAVGEIRYERIESC